MLLRGIWCRLELRGRGCDKKHETCTRNLKAWTNVGNECWQRSPLYWLLDYVWRKKKFWGLWNTRFCNVDTIHNEDFFVMLKLYTTRTSDVYYTDAWFSDWSHHVVYKGNSYPTIFFKFSKGKDLIHFMANDNRADNLTGSYKPWLRNRTIHCEIVWILPGLQQASTYCTWLSYNSANS